MGRSVVDWTVRVAMMALAGFVSLSILGAVATMTTDAGPRAFVVETSPPPVPQAAPEEPRDEPAQSGTGTVFAPAGERQTAPAGPGAAPPEERAERWLEAIAYALLALAGLAALAVLLLWRLVRELRRLADARG